MEYIEKNLHLLGEIIPILNKEQKEVFELLHGEKIRKISNELESIQSDLLDNFLFQSQIEELQKQELEDNNIIKKLYPYYFFIKCMES